jgi:hypothetical protein
MERRLGFSGRGGAMDGRGGSRARAGLLPEEEGDADRWGRAVNRRGENERV